ncbi:hypothetical protein M3Y99_01398500 [Aphelenchoides fujianensis]|nr:hypothetical protein M3Y99_01398500 [Aphelenchoides fujianensis]
MAPLDDRLPVLRDDAHSPQQQPAGHARDHPPTQHHPGHQPSISNVSAASVHSASSSNTDESEESYLDSLEEGRAPLLGDHDDDEDGLEGPRHRSHRGNGGTYGEERGSGRTHRFPKERRIATIGALLYLGRCVTMFVTRLPKADPNYYCSPKLNPENRTMIEVFWRALRILSSVGLAINGNENLSLCGDYIYSGHTVVLVTCYLFIRECEQPRGTGEFCTGCRPSLRPLGVVCLLISRGHYTVDVVIAYWITTRVFWQYHTLASFAVLREGRQENNHLQKVIWFPLFKYMESNVLRPLPHYYGLPFSWERVRRMRWFKRNDQ